MNSAGWRGSMSLSPSGKRCVIASCTGLQVWELDNPDSTVQHYQHHSIWDVADVQWSPFQSRKHRVVSTSNQKALVWNLDLPVKNAVEHTLHQHTRALTDVNFSRIEQDMLATCSVDTFIHCWDLRIPRQPVVSFCDWDAAAMHVKWSPFDKFKLASSHDKHLKVWDMRYGARPVRNIRAHSSKIYCIDWSLTKDTSLLTCALDKKIKFWNYKNPKDEPENVLMLEFSACRARHTPFGSSLLVMPQSCEDTKLYVYDLDTDFYSNNKATQKLAFAGEDGGVKEFVWRRPPSSESELRTQLVTWSQDRTIRIWSPVDPTCLEKKTVTPLPGRERQIEFALHSHEAWSRAYGVETLRTPQAPGSETTQAIFQQSRTYRGPKAKPGPQFSPHAQRKPKSTGNIHNLQAYFGHIDRETRSCRFSLVAKTKNGVILGSMDGCVTFPGPKNQSSLPKIDFDDKAILQSAKVQTKAMKAGIQRPYSLKDGEEYLKEYLARLTARTSAKFNTDDMRDYSSDDADSTYSGGMRTKALVPHPRSCGAIFSRTGAIAVFRATSQETRSAIMVVPPEHMPTYDAAEHADYLEDLLRPVKGAVVEHFYETLLDFPPQKYEPPLPTLSRNNTSFFENSINSFSTYRSSSTYNNSRSSRYPSNIIIKATSFYDPSDDIQSWSMKSLLEDCEKEHDLEMMYKLKAFLYLSLLNETTEPPSKEQKPPPPPKPYEPSPNWPIDLLHRTHDLPEPNHDIVHQLRKPSYLHSRTNLNKQSPDWRLYPQQYPHTDLKPDESADILVGTEDMHARLKLGKLFALSADLSTFPGKRIIPIARYASTEKSCSLCEVVLKGLYSACLVCGHIYHSECARSWFDENYACSTGCGCECRVHIHQTGGEDVLEEATKFDAAVETVSAKVG